MSLQTAVAVPFRGAGAERLDEGKFVVALSLDRDWFSPEQAKRLLDVADGRGLVERADGEVVATFDPASVDVPEGFRPDESVLREASAFEQVLDALVAAGADKRAAVAAINERQRELGVDLEAAAVLYACQEGVDPEDAVERIRGDLRER